MTEARTLSEPIQPPQQPRAWMAHIALVAALCVGLAGCGTPTPDKTPRTQSDQTDIDKRSAVHVDLAAGYFSRGMNSTALDETKQALVIKPKSLEAMNLQGLIYGAMGESRLADEAFRNALATAPNNPDTLHNYGWMLCQQRRFDEAARQFNAALAQPEYRGGARTLRAEGVCEARAGDNAKAELTLAKAFEAAPGDPVTNYNYAEVLLRNGKLDRAMFYIKRVNAVPAQVTAQSLWLQARVGHRMGDTLGVKILGEQLHKDFAQSPETQALDAGRFDE
ncbi:MAG: type IV pilus biogenesis/stability protein PilW [Paucibacter sp.]|nr:type IV pilus biogenesis/stability protein PilW [Roseateles sp.]